MESEQTWTRALADGGVANMPKVEPTKRGGYYVEAGLGTPQPHARPALLLAAGVALSEVLADQPSDSLLHDIYFALGALIARGAT